MWEIKSKFCFSPFLPGSPYECVLSNIRHANLKGHEPGHNQTLVPNTYTVSIILRKVVHSFVGGEIIIMKSYFLIHKLA